MINLAQRYKGIVFYNPAECRVLIDTRTVELIKKDLERLEKQDKILNALLKNADYTYDEWYGMRGNQCIMIGITEKDECFEEIREMVENER